MKILILLPLLLTLQTSFGSTLVGVGDAKSSIQGCRTFTVDKCTEGSIHETVTDVDDVATCQIYCRDIFTAFCKFFMLDFKQRVSYWLIIVTVMQCVNYFFITNESPQTVILKQN